MHNVSPPMVSVYSLRSQRPILCPCALKKFKRPARGIHFVRRGGGGSNSSSASSSDSSDSGVGVVVVSREVAVELKCGKCVDDVTRILTNMPEVVAADVSLEAQAVTVDATCDTNKIVHALTAEGYNARAIGYGSASDDQLLGADDGGEQLAEQLGTNVRTLKQSLSAVAEFKGDMYGHKAVVGVVRLMQVDDAAPVIEAHLQGLQPGVAYNLSVRSSGDSTNGVASAGAVYSKGGAVASGVVADDAGHLDVPPVRGDDAMRTWDVIGRSFCVARSDDESDGVVAVLARSAAVGDNTAKRVCQCDGTVIWESTPDDFKPGINFA
ncbi:hypothetical protein PPROV_001087300 [Pycnococcus provasolii]|uniref:HMA domain-containing protein n=1 Tax=Pycnococcus provasolii TaxID=41880 RepID=A0A830HZU7_9CHLO|nr:hypothetical protein PPROV_001087300 [Pycnococcus provasolii]